MSDFLGRLAARALGQVPPVRPRMPSRFEPAAGLVEEEVAVPPASPPRLSRPSRPSGERRGENRDRGPAMEERDLHDAKAVEPPAAASGVQSQMPDLAGPDVTPLRGWPSLPNPSLPASPPPAGREGLPELAPPAEVSLFSRREGGRPGEEGRGDEGQPAGSAEAAFVAIPAPPPESAFRRPAERIPESSPSSTGTAPLPTSPGPRDEHRGERDLPARRPLIPRAVLREEPPRPGITPLPGATLPSLHAEAGPAPAAEPVIRVTIGRIEVRAAAPAPPQAPAPRPAAARLTLEEYLRRRGEERM